MTRQQGSLTDWNDDRGFGFIVPAAGGPRLFVHASAFPRGPRPATDDRVTYLVGQDGRGRLRASEVRLLHPARAGRRRTRGLAGALLTTVLFGLLLVGLAVLDEVPALVLLAYGLFSVTAFGMYRSDKVAATRGDWRIPEANLHAVAVVGGWPGALIARRAFRHKTTKQPFRTVFWGTVLVNCAALGWLVEGMPLPAVLTSFR